MKKFNYKVEPYLKYVKHLRDKALRVLKDAEASVRRVEENMKKTDDKIKTAYQKNSDMGKGVKDIHYIHDNNLYLRSLKKKMEGFAEDLKMAEDVYKDKYQKLMSLQQKLRSIELHKEKAVKDYKDLYRKHQQKVYDEINSARHGRKNAKPIR